ncbi:MAG: hypothetical protein WCA46_04000, partial [Actinocatenispora sp.]
MALAATAFGILAPAAPAAADPTHLDVHAAIRALGSEQIHAAPGAPARLDRERVGRAIAGSKIHVLLAPFPDVSSESHTYYDRVYAPLADWARGGREVILVTGLQVNMVSSGEVVPTDLPEARQRLERFDVTSGVMFAVRYLRDGVERSDDWAARQGPADPAEVRRWVAALRHEPVHSAPGAVVTVDPHADWDRLGGHHVRIAVLPPVDPDAPTPALLPALAKAFPDDIVIVVRGRWFDAAGPLPAATIGQAHDYAISLTSSYELRQNFPYDAVLRPFLRRVTLLAAGEPYNRPLLRPTRLDVGAVVTRTAPWLFLAVCALLAAAVGGWWSVRTLRRRRDEALAVR